MAGPPVECCRGRDSRARPRSGNSTADSIGSTVPCAVPPDASLRGAKRRGNLVQAVTFSPGVPCYPAGYCEIAPQGHFLALRAQGATAPLGPRNDKPLVFAILTAARLFRRCSAGPGCPRPYMGRRIRRSCTEIYSCRQLIPQRAGNPKNSGGDSAGVYGNLIIRQRRAIDREHSARDFSSRRDSGSAGILCVFQAFRTDGSAENIRRRPRMRLRGVAAIRTGRKSCRSRPRRCARQRGPSAGRAWS